MVLVLPWARQVMYQPHPSSRVRIHSLYTACAISSRGHCPFPEGAARFLLVSDGAVLNPRDTSLEAVEEVLHNMCTLMKGSVRPGKTLIKSSIRYLLLVTTCSCVIAACVQALDSLLTASSPRQFSHVGISDSSHIKGFHIGSLFPV